MTHSKRILLRLAPLLCLVPPIPGGCAQDRLQTEIQRLDRAWVEAQYTELPGEQREQRFKALLADAEKLELHHPGHAEPLALQGLLLSSLAATTANLDSLFHLGEARKRLEKSIALDPGALNSSAQITLGALFHCAPPLISFRDDGKARHLFEDALERHPETSDANYYLGAFLLEQGEFGPALPYLEKAAHLLAQDDGRLDNRYFSQQASTLLIAARQRRIVELICAEP